MNLEALALRRAEETLRSMSREEITGPTLRVVRRPVPASGLKCSCGECHRCKNRIAMREHRAAKRVGTWTPSQPGRKTTLGRECSDCGKTIWDKNTTGLCGKCGHERKLRAGRVAVRRHYYSHGGGI